MEGLAELRAVINLDLQAATLTAQFNKSDIKQDYSLIRRLHSYLQLFQECKESDMV